MDVKDRKLIYYLSQNARLTDTWLTKRIELSKNAIKYRRERLIKQGIVRSFGCAIHLGALGYETVTMLLRFNKQSDATITYFKNHPFTDFVVTLVGGFDILAEFVVTDMHHMHKIITEIVTNFHETLNAYDIYFSFDILRVEHLVADFYQDLKFEAPEPVPRQIKNVKLSSTDKQILAELAEDASQDLITIGKKLGTSIDVVRYHLKQLKEKGVLLKTFADISLSSLGYQEYVFSIQLKNISAEKVQSIKRLLQTNTNVTYAFFDIISFRILCVCAFKNVQGMDEFSRQLRQNYGDIMQNEWYVLITNHVVFNLFPRGLVE